MGVITDFYHLALSVTDSSSNGHLRLRMMYNTAVLRSRRLQKRVTERSLTSSHGEHHMLSKHGKPEDHRRAQDTVDSQHLGAKSRHKSVAHVRESVPGVSDRQHLFTSQNNMKITAASGRTDISHSASGGQHIITCPTRIAETTDAGRAAVKQSSGISASGTVSPAAGIPPHPVQPPKLLLACGTTDDIEIYATLGRKTRQQKPVQQHCLDSFGLPQRNSYSGVSSSLGYDSWNDNNQMIPGSRYTRRETSLAQDSLSHLKISWSVEDQMFDLN